jgi:hypothetical protein
MKQILKSLCAFFGVSLNISDFFFTVFPIPSYTTVAFSPHLRLVQSTHVLQTNTYHRFGIVGSPIQVTVAGAQTDNNKA